MQMGVGSIVAADFNGDKKLDVALVQNGVVSILLGNGNGMFQSSMNYGSDAYPSTLASGDFNRDGVTDLFVTNFNGNNPTHVSNTARKW